MTSYEIFLNSIPKLTSFLKEVFKLRLGALIPRSVGPLVGWSVGPPKITKKITKLYKTLQNVTKNYKSLK